MSIEASKTQKYREKKGKDRTNNPRTVRQIYQRRNVLMEYQEEKKEKNRRNMKQ